MSNVWCGVARHGRAKTTPAAHTENCCQNYSISLAPLAIRERASDKSKETLDAETVIRQSGSSIQFQHSLRLSNSG